VDTFEKDEFLALLQVGISKWKKLFTKI